MSLIMNPDRERFRPIEKEDVRSLATVTQLRQQLRQCEADKAQLQASYDEALQALADSEAKRETADKELSIARDQMRSMWQELDSLHHRLNDSSACPEQTPTGHVPSTVGNPSMELHCTLCHERISPGPSLETSTRPRSSRAAGIWPFARKLRVDHLNQHSRVCSSKLVHPRSNSPSSSPNSTMRRSPVRMPAKNKPSPEKASLPPVIVNVTRTPTAATADLAPFKIVTKTSLPQFQGDSYEVYRSAGDFQWLHDALKDSCPERIIPPLRSTISLDATVSGYQQFLSRLCHHKVLRTEHIFVTFLTGSVEELRGLRAKFRPRLPSEEVGQFGPAQGRDTSSGALVATKIYLRGLEEHLSTLALLLQQTTTHKPETMSSCLRAISEAEPCSSYLQKAAESLSRTCQATESQHTDGEDIVCLQNLQSIADYIHAAQDLLTRVENAVDKFLFWDEEVTIYEAVTSSPGGEAQLPPSCQEDAVFDDSGVSSISGSSSSGSSSLCQRQPASASNGEHRLAEGSISEKWAQASSACTDAKEYLEMMCCDLSEELSYFDLRKEQELRQVFLEFAAAQLARHEKLQGKWFAMQFLLEEPICLELRAIQFLSASSGREAGTVRVSNSSTTGSNL